MERKGEFFSKDKISIFNISEKCKENIKSVEKNSIPSSNFKI